MIALRISRLAAIAVFVPAAVFAGTPSGTPQAAPAREKLICKSFSQTGSLVSKNRVCKTSKEWEFNRAQLRQQTGTSSCSTDGAGCTVPGK